MTEYICNVCKKPIIDHELLKYSINCVRVYIHLNCAKDDPNLSNRIYNLK